MGLTYLALYKGKGTLFNRLIRLWTRSKYSHCEIVLSAHNESLVVDDSGAVWLSASAMDGGVRSKEIELNLEHWDLIPVPWADRSRINWVFQKHRGKGYDWLGIFFSQLLASGLHSLRRMFCSEFCAAALGLPNPQRYSPAQLGEVVNHINRLIFAQLGHSLKEG